MKILLIEPPFYLLQDIKSGSASLGLAMLAAVAHREGHEVKIFAPDLEFLASGKREGVITNYSGIDEKMSRVKLQLGEIMKSLQPDIVGISIWTARVMTSLELAKHIKSIDSRMIIVGGGVHSTIMPDDMLKSGLFDYLIRGEGEIAFTSLLHALQNGRDPKKENINCLSFIDGHGNFIHNPITYCDNLDGLTFPGYEHFINYEKFDKNAFKSIMYSRGCPFDCNYCASHKIWTRKTRAHSPSYIVRMIKHIHYKFGTTYFRFDDDTFTLKPGPVREICELLKHEKLPIKWCCDTRVECVTPELLLEMKEVGLDFISMGVESGDPDMRKKIRKNSSLEVTKKAFRIAADAGIFTNAYFMIGFPGETFEQANRTLDFIEELNPNYPCISVCIPYPGTDCYDIALEMGIIKQGEDSDWFRFYHHSNVNFSGRINEKEWDALLKRCERIEQKAMQRIEQERLKKITIKEIISRYTGNPSLIFSDFKRVYRWVQKK